MFGFLPSFYCSFVVAFMIQTFIFLYKGKTIEIYDISGLSIFLIILINVFSCILQTVLG